MTEFTEIDLQQEQKQPKASETDKFYAKGDGEVVKVFFSSLTPNQEVETVRVDNCWLGFLACMFSIGINTKWQILSNFFFFGGNFFYVWISINDLKSLNATTGEEMDSGSDDTLFNFLNFSAAILFLLNPVSDFLANWAENKVTEMNDTLQHKDYSTKDIHSKAETVSVKKQLFTIDGLDWNKWVAIVFFVGSALYLWQAFLDAQLEDVTYYQALDITASHVFLFDSILALRAWYVARCDDAGTSRERRVFTFNPRKLDWSGWGDFLFFAGSILDAAVSYMNPPVFSPRLIYSLELTSNILWMVDALLYTIGYCFGQDLRRKFGNRDYTSLIHVEEEEHEKYSSKLSINSGMQNGDVELT